MFRPLRSALLAALLAIGPAATAMADQLLLQQILPVDQAGRAFLLVDRLRIGHVVATKESGQAHRITIHLATEPPVEIAFTCNDQAITTQVLQALRPGAIATLDVTGRCRL